MTAESPSYIRSPRSPSGWRGADNGNGPAVNSSAAPSKYRSPSPRRRSPSPGDRRHSRRSPSPRRYDSRSPPPPSRYSSSYSSNSRRYDGPRRERRPVNRGDPEERARSTTLFIGNIPYLYKEPDVASLADKYGALRKVTIPLDRITGNNRGYAFVEFESRRDAEEAFNALSGGYKLQDRELRIDWDVGRENKAYPERRPDRDLDRRRYSRSPPPRSPRRRSRSRSPPPPPPYSSSTSRYERDYPPRRDDYRSSRDHGSASGSGRRYPDYPPRDDYRAPSDYRAPMAPRDDYRGPSTSSSSAPMSGPGADRFRSY